jgi:hypothetical protein
MPKTGNHFGEGDTVDAAAADARKGIFLERGDDDRSWFTPVVFMRTPDGRLFNFSGAMG